MAKKSPPAPGSSGASLVFARLSRFATVLVVFSLTGVATGQPPAVASNELTKLALEHERTTPAEILDGTLLLLDLGAVEPAQELFARLTAMNLSDEEQVTLAREVGTAKLMRLTRSSQLGEPAREWVRSATAAVERRVRDPQRIAQSIAQLANPAADTRAAAMIQLLEAGPAAAAPAVAALAQPENEQQRQALREVLIQLDPASRGPLLAAFDSNQPRLIAEVIGLSARLGLVRAIPYLAAMTASAEANVASAAKDALASINASLPSDLTTVLTAAIDEQLARGLPSRSDSEHQVEVWLWDSQARIPVSLRVPARDAGVVAAARLAQLLSEVSPEHRQRVGSLTIVTQLEAAAIQAAGDEQNLVGVRERTLNEVRPEDLNQALAWALDGEYFRAATMLAQTLGVRGDASLLATSAPRPSPLVQAATSGYRPLQAAAVAAIGALAPQEPFAGSSRVVEVLKYLGGSTGESRVIIAMPNPQRALTLAGQLAELGFDGQGVSTGRACVQAAVASSDVEFVLVDAQISSFGIREVLYELRSNPLTARLPIGILAGGQQFRRAKRLADEHHRVVAFVRPSDPVIAQQIANERRSAATDTAQPDPLATTDGADVKAIVTRLDALAAAEGLSAEQRQEAALAALQAAVRYAADPPSAAIAAAVEPLVVESLQEDTLAAAAASALATRGSHVSQLALVELASRSDAPIETRQNAAVAFRASVREFGLTLNREDILRQYERLKSARGTDRETQGILGHLLNTIEAPVASHPG